MSEKSDCCSAAPKLIFSCSGAADLGAIADQAARKLSREGVGKMFCLAGVGGRVSGIMKTTEAAGERLVIDGCALDCAATGHSATSTTIAVLMLRSALSRRSLVTCSTRALICSMRLGVNARCTRFLRR